MIDKFTEQRIKEAAHIEDVITDYGINLRRCGSELSCACPFHKGQKLGHFMVNPRKNFYHCFVCGEHGGPIDWLMRYDNLSYPDALRFLAQKYGIYIEEERPRKFEKARPAALRPVEKIEELPMLVLPIDLVKSQMDTSEDTLCNWMRSLPWTEERRERLEKVLRSYGVGHSARTGMTIFWQIDEKGQVRTGKMMRYRSDGHRDKESRYSMDWIHATLSRKKHPDDPWPYPNLFNPDKQQMKTCFFGQHLLNAKVQSHTVNIVESEKTALIMATYTGSASGIWLATGGMQFLRRDSIKNLLDYGWKVVLYPDKDGAERWEKVMTDFGFTKASQDNPDGDYLISNLFLDAIAQWREEDGPKADAADVVVRFMTEKARARDTRPLWDMLGKWEKKNPAIGQLVSKFNLEPIKRRSSCKTMNATRY